MTRAELKKIQDLVNDMVADLDKKIVKMDKAEDEGKTKLYQRLDRETDEITGGIKGIESVLGTLGCGMRWSAQLCKYLVFDQYGEFVK